MVAIALDKNGEIAADPEVALDGVPGSTLDGRSMEEIVYNTVDTTVDSIPQKRRKDDPAGELPSPIDLPAGCRFQTRCPYRRDVCGERVPELRVVDDRLVRCHFADEPGFPLQSATSHAEAAGT